MTLQLDKKKTKNNQLVIFGEMHNPKDHARVMQEINKLHSAGKINYILSEELGPFAYLNKKDIEKGIAEMENQIGEETFKLGLKFNVPVIGIDLWDPEVYKDDVYADDNIHVIDVKRSFALREAQMVKVISEWLPKGDGVMIVGDTHLRTVPSPQDLGPVSLIWTAYRNNPNVKFIRSPEKEIK